MSHAILYHSSPYYAHLSQTTKGPRPGDWGRFLVIAATREDMKRFFRGLQKYTKIGNTTISELIQKIYQMDTSYYGNIEELNETYGKIQVTRLADGIGTKDWPILPLQDVSLRDLQMHD
ncbi:hypothetical protein MHUMG1_07407 [Metarhizium humberi]|uniref:Uncharacterized protein n=1 Tax=Metarhizium humberi TaxID=2596975 RepID=A0A9P8S5S5_9HYPO|nr:hypothetical protein MHUMG1_07407 [Metarhizium humberi]